MIARLRPHASIIAVMAVAAALRLPALGWLPSPAGDEGNWTLYALRLLQGQPVALAPDAAFVSLLYARLIAGSMAALGPSFFAARLVGVLAVLAAIAAGFLLLNRLGSRRAALAFAAVLAVHPWSVLYSRICSVPYAVALATMVLGPLLFLAGLHAKRMASLAAGILVTSLGGHFSPLTVAGAAACGAITLLPDHRWIWSRWATYAALAAGAVHVAPVVQAAATLAASVPEPTGAGTFWTHLGSYLHMVATGLAGEATLRHFTNSALPWTWSLVPAAAAAAVVPVACRRAPALGVLGVFGPLYFTVSLTVVPLVLAPGRNWEMPVNHYDRYLFALLPGFALCTALVAARAGGAARALTLAVIGWAGLGTARAGHALLIAGGVDHGEFIFDGGGGYRGWLVSSQPRATLLQVRDIVLAHAGDRGATVLVADRVFIPLTFLFDGTAVSVSDVRRAGIPSRADGRYFALVWPDEVLSVDSPPTASPKYVASNQALRSRLERFFASRVLLHRFVQPDGRPLLELWRVEQPRPRLANRPVSPP